MKNICAFILICLSSAFYAQNIESPINSLKGKRDFIYGIDNRRTHIKEQSTVIYGAYLGFGFDEKLRLKLGLSGTPFEVGKTTDALGSYTKHRLLFLTLGEEFDFFIHKRFRMTTYVQLGCGFDFSRTTSASGIVVQTDRNVILPLEIGMHFNYDIFPWLRAKLGGGWRFVLPASANELSGYYLKLGFGFSWSKFKDTQLLKKKQKTSRT